MPFLSGIGSGEYQSSWKSISRSLQVKDGVFVSDCRPSTTGSLLVVVVGARKWMRCPRYVHYLIPLVSVRFRYFFCLLLVLLCTVDETQGVSTRSTNYLQATAS